MAPCSVGVDHPRTAVERRRPSEPFWPSRRLVFRVDLRRRYRARRYQKHEVLRRHIVLPHLYGGLQLHHKLGELLALIYGVGTQPVPQREELVEHEERGVQGKDRARQLLHGAPYGYEDFAARPHTG
jgi:hypothetical protein